MKLKNLKSIFLAFSVSIIICFSVVLELTAVVSSTYKENHYNYYKVHKVASEKLMTASYSSNLTEYKDCKQAYFDNLTTNFGKNYKGSCAYVAIGMLLSYYDTLLNDNIVPEQYDVISSGFDTNIISRHNSPGTLSENISDPNNNKSNYKYATEMTALEYYTSISAIAEHSLHAKLITLGAETTHYDFNDNDNPCGLSTFYIDFITNRFLTNVSGFTAEKDYEIYSMSRSKAESNAVRGQIISYLNSGLPVLIGVVDKNNNGHGCIAYDYDAITDKIYCHMGWGASTTHVTIESQGFQYYVYAMAVNFKIGHNHPQNYEVVSLNNNKAQVATYCICSDDILAIHNHSYNYSGHGATTHFLNCSCGIKKTQNHIYTHSYTNTDSSTHIAYCGCGMSISESHTYGKYQKYNNDFHASYCECGEQKIIRHKYITFNVSGHEIIQCVLCGQYKYEAVIDPGMNSTTIEEYFLNLEVERQQKRKTKID